MSPCLSVRIAGSIRQEWQWEGRRPLARAGEFDSIGPVSETVMVIQTEHQLGLHPGYRQLSLVHPIDCTRYSHVTTHNLTHQPRPVKLDLTRPTYRRAISPRPSRPSHPSHGVQPLRRLGHNSSIIRKRRTRLALLSRVSRSADFGLVLFLLCPSVIGWAAQLGAAPLAVEIAQRLCRNRRVPGFAPGWEDNV